MQVLSPPCYIIYLSRLCRIFSSRPYYYIVTRRVNRSRSSLRAVENGFFMRKNKPSSPGKTGTQLRYKIILYLYNIHYTSSYTRAYIGRCDVMCYVCVHVVAVLWRFKWDRPPMVAVRTTSTTMLYGIDSNTVYYTSTWYRNDTLIGLSPSGDRLPVVEKRINATASARTIIYIYYSYYLLVVI